MKEEKHGLSESLENVARIARATAWKRLIHAPIRYLTGQFFNKIIYPFSKEQKLVQAKTFFGVEMKVALPAGSDIYFTAGKSHPCRLFYLSMERQHQFLFGSLFFKIAP